MKKLLAIFIAAVIILGAVEVVRKPSAQQIVDDFDSIVHVISLTQITRDSKLIGKRENVGKDTYIGIYSSSCISENGRDVVFGGASVKDRKIKLKVKILTESGAASLRVRTGSDVKEYSVDENGIIEKTFDFDSGGNYAMIIYNNFTGTVEMTSEYAK